MKKSDLKSKMVVKTRNGEMWLVVDDVFIKINGFTTFTEYNEELRCEENKNYDIVKVYRYINENYNNSNVSGITTMLNEENLTLLWERKEVKLTNKEIEVLKALKLLGFKWIARDSDKVYGSLFAYIEVPAKHQSYWRNVGVQNYYNLEKELRNLFKFITWEDKEQTSIEELLKENEINEKNS